MNRERRRRIRRRKRILHNIRAVCLWILTALLLIAMISGIVRGIRSLINKGSGKNGSSEATLQLDSESESLSTEETTESPGLVQEAEEDKDIHLVMIGDILAHEGVLEAAHQADGSYDFTQVFSGIREDVQAADLALVNEEVIIGGEELGISGYPTFNAPFELADNLVDTGFNVILHATNHAYDQGAEGILSCLQNWESKYPGEIVLGIHDTDDDLCTIGYYEKNGIRIAILNFTYGINQDAFYTSEYTYMVDLLWEDQVREGIREAKQNADFIIVCPHWGTEFSLEADAKQTKFVEIFEEEGVDLVLGSHPHVIEPVEMVTDSGTGHQMLVYYSVGNFVSWTSSEGQGVMNRSVGGMADVTIGELEDGSIGIKDYGITAVVCHLTEGTNGVKVYKFSDYSEELAEQNEIKKQDSDFSYEAVRELCDQVWGSSWQ